MSQPPEAEPVTVVPAEPASTTEPASATTPTAPVTRTSFWRERRKSTVRPPFIYFIYLFLKWG